MTLPLSVVLATTDPPPWPDLIACLRILEPQVRRAGGELIVGESCGVAVGERGFPDSPCLVWSSLAGGSVFDLRARALQLARGNLIATTEDHCLVAPDWCDQILAGFRSAPEALALYGPVLNGSPNRRIDWANYLHTFGMLLPPYDPNRFGRCPPNANVAYRRSALAPPGSEVRPGWMELEVNPRLFREGRFRFWERMVATHVQSHGLWGTFLAHFHNGRSTTGLSRAGLSRRQLPWRLYRETVRGLGGGEAYRDLISASLPLLFLLSCCHAIGEVAGVLLGAGHSPARLR